MSMLHATSITLYVFLLFLPYNSIVLSNAELNERRKCETFIICCPVENCTGWNKPEFIEDANDKEVTVCRNGEEEAFIQPLNYLVIDDAQIHYNHLTDKFYTTYKVQLTSKKILKQLGRKSEFNNTKVSFEEVTQIRFLAASPEFFKIRSDVQLNQEWKKIYSRTSEKDKFIKLQFRTDTRESAERIISAVTASNTSESTPGRIVLDTVDIEMKTKHNSNSSRTSLKMPSHACKEENVFIDMLDLNGKIFPLQLVKSTSLMIAYPVLVGQDWILMQRRDTAGFDFNRKWMEYRNGFGDWKNDFWLGLDKIYEITKNGDYGLRMEFESHKGLQRSAQWANFRVGSEAGKYKLNVSGYDLTSSAGLDRLSYSNGQEFATVDNDNLHSCAMKSGGGWWFVHCIACHFNNELRSSIGNSPTCVFYYYFRGHTYGNECLKRVRMFLIKR